MTTEIYRELAYNEMDKENIKVELEQAKNQFIDSIINGLGDEIKNCPIENKPIKMKKTFKMRIKDFFSKIANVLGG